MEHTEINISTALRSRHKRQTRRLLGPHTLRVGFDGMRAKSKVLRARADASGLRRLSSDSIGTRPRVSDSDSGGRGTRLRPVFQSGQQLKTGYETKPWLRKRAGSSVVANGGRAPTPLDAARRVSENEARGLGRGPGRSRLD